MYDIRRVMQYNMANHSGSQAMLFTVGKKLGITAYV